MPAGTRKYAAIIERLALIAEELERSGDRKSLKLAAELDRTAWNLYADPESELSDCAGLAKLARYYLATMA